MKKIFILILMLLFPFNVFAVEKNDKLIMGATSGILIDAVSGKIIAVLSQSGERTY